MLGGWAGDRVPTDDLLFADDTLAKFKTSTLDLLGDLAAAGSRTLTRINVGPKLNLCTGTVLDFNRSLERSAAETAAHSIPIKFAEESFVVAED